MVTAGVDAGFESVKVVVLEDGKVLSRALGTSGGLERKKAVLAVWDEALKAAGIPASSVARTVATGQGKYDADFADGCVTEPIADGRAASFVFPEAESVVDIGADQARVVPLKGDGVLQTALSQKCSSGIGAFIRHMAGRLEIGLDGLGALAPDACGGKTVNDGCIVFAELDALELLNQNVPRKEVAGALINAMAVRLNSVIQDKVVPPRDGAVLFGGITKNAALVEALKARSGINFIVPEHAEYGCALGAALIAADEGGAAPKQ
ncbi:MAG: acyl-CoA dehydratase activase [Clostridiales Family XIII bacterium]|jgi:benzoyl-CoA reductase subunit D|nr:acyl-CoA dehydratase activase [Clostridiales Family XIII bacterium]